MADDGRFPEDDLDTSPFTHENIHQLGWKKNWPTLRKIITPALSVNVTDLRSQAFLDNVQAKFNYDLKKQMSLGWCIISILLREAEDDDEAYNILKLLLTLGVDPDRPMQRSDRRGQCPSHLCGELGLPKAASAIFPCRPELGRLNYGGLTPYATATLEDSKDDASFPHRRVLRADVADFLRINGYHVGTFPSLASLALRKQWFAVLNLVRRNKIPPEEFNAEVEGKTAREWAMYHEEFGIAEELRYCARPLRIRHVEAVARVRELERELEMEEDHSQALEATVDELKTEVSSLKKEVKEKNDKIVELEEVVLALSTSRDADSAGKQDEAGNPSVTKKRKVEAAGRG